MDKRLTASWSPVHTSPPPSVSQHHLLFDKSIQWRTCGRIGSVIYPSDSAFGQPTVLECAANALAIGTTDSCVLVFDYNQIFLRALKPPRLRGGQYGPVTAIAISNDGDFVSAGYEQGHVVVWKIEQVFMSIEPLIRPPASYDAGHETHLRGSAVISLKFVPGRHSLILSADNHGIVILHHSMRLLLEHRARSRRLLGTYNSLKPATLFAIDAFQMSGTVLLAAISPFNLCVLTLDPQRIILHVPRSAENVRLNTGVSGFMAWNDSTCQLIWGWADLLVVMKAVLSPKGIHFVAEAQYRCFETLVHIDWLDQQFPVILGLTVTQKLILLRLDTLEIIDAHDIANKHAIHRDFFSHAIAVVTDQFPSIRTCNGNIFLLGKYEFSRGSLNNWADRLMSLLDSSESSADAVVLAAQFFQDKSDILGLLGLPMNLHARKEAVRQAFPDIVLSAVRFAVSHGVEDISRLLSVCTRAITVVDVPLLEQILDVIQSDKEALDIYLNTLTDLVLEGTINSLPPRIFRELLLVHSDSDVLESVIYRLDPSTLDFDLAMILCKQKKLDGVYVYLCVCLRDFHSPIEFPTKCTMTFIAYTLTGRVYPTGSPLTNESDAKRQVWSDILKFSKLLIEYDASGFFLALNEGFEDDFLNEDDEVSRQIVVNTVMHVYEGENAENRIQLNVFLGRQLPKYRQYLLLPGSLIDKIIDDLCSTGKTYHEERELAILSLLSIYKPPKLNELMARLFDGGFWLAIEQIYRSKRNWSGLALLQVKTPDVSWSILRECLINGQGRIFKDHFSAFATKDASETAKLVNEFGISVWDECFALEDPLPYLEAHFTVCNTLPPMRVRTVYISLLSKDHDKLFFALEKQLSGPGDINPDEVSRALVKNDAKDALALLLCRSKRHEEALNYVISSLHEPGYCDLATHICRESRDPRLWKLLVDKLTELDKSEELRRVVQVLVETDELAVELVPQQPQAIQDALMLMRRQESFLNTVLSLLNRDSYRFFVQKLTINLKGWAVALDCDCECCGNKVCGVGVDASLLYDLWQRNQKNLDIPSRYISSQSLAIFNCGHTYHLKCLERLSPAKVCPMCTA